MSTSRTLSWRDRNAWIADLLERRTGQDVEAWNRRIREEGFADEASLRKWLSTEGVSGYPQMLLIMERFGYPDFLVASADELVDGQYADRRDLRPILDALLARAVSIGDVTIQARKTCVSLLSPRRTFASVEPTTKRRVDLGLRLADQKLAGRLEPARGMGNNAVTVRIGLMSPDEVDDEVESWLRRAYAENS